MIRVTVVYSRRQIDGLAKQVRSSRLEAISLQEAYFAAKRSIRPGEFVSEMHEVAL